MQHQRMLHRNRNERSFLARRRFKRNSIDREHRIRGRGHEIGLSIRDYSWSTAPLAQLASRE